MSVVEGRADIKDLLLESTSTGTRRLVRPSGGGVVNSLARRGCGPVVLVHTQNFRLPIRKAHLGTTSDTRLFSGEKQTSHFKRVTTVFAPARVETFFVPQ